MSQQGSIWRWQLKLASFLAIGYAIASYENCTAQVIPDNTLGAESSVVKPIAPEIDQIEGGATRGTNLYHSFEQFSVLTNGKVRFNNNQNIQNIITRVTGFSASNIDGLIEANGTANLFLINPNGIIFGRNASLNIGGSFLASTASSLNFDNSSRFSATDTQTTPLLEISVPTGLQFGTNPGSIINRSQASQDGVINSFGFPGGLKVQPGKTLALVGGDILQEGGNLTAEAGRIELGSVAGNSLVSLNLIEKGWALGYEGVQNFQNIQLTPPETFNQTGIPSYVDVSGEGGGDIQLQGRQIRITDSPLIAQTTGGLQSGSLTLTASESIELIGSTILTTLTRSSGNAGDITINTGQLTVQDGAQVITSTLGTGSGGQLTVNASDSVYLIGSSLSRPDNTYLPSGLFTSTVVNGNAGNLTINTGRLRIQNGAGISTQSTRLIDPSSGQRIPATGRGGNLTVKAFDSVELSGTRPDGTPSSILANTQGTGDAGNIAISTGQLLVQNKAEVAVGSEGTGNAGNLDVTANSIRLENGGKLLSTSTLGNGGGNITINNQDLLLLRGNGEISTNAGGAGNGGNININTDVLAATDRSNITAKAVRGRGGNIRIATQGLFVSPDSQINAASEQGINGVVEINRPDIDPTSELVTLPAEIVDVSGLVASGCGAGGGNLARGTGEFVVTGRGGLPPNPAEATRSDTVLADLGRSVQSDGNRASAEIPGSNPISSNTSAKSTTLVEASGWVIGSKGEVILTANNPTFTSDIPWLKPNSCNGS